MTMQFLPNLNILNTKFFSEIVPQFFSTYKRENKIENLYCISEWSRLTFRFSKPNSKRGKPMRIIIYIQQYTLKSLILLNSHLISLVVFCTRVKCST